MKSHARIVLAGLLISGLMAGWLPGAQPAASDAPATRGRYLALTSQPGTPAPFASADILRGPTEKIGRQVWHWWQLEVRTNQASAPQFQLRVLTSSDPLAAQSGNLAFARYLLRLPALNETLEFRDRHTGLALLPGWKDFDRWFVPHPAASSHFQKGLPETCEYLGHVLTLASTSTGETWRAWTDAKLLDLDRELLVGTGRNFKDKEGQRLPQKPERRDYTYIPFGEDDYRVMLDAGINLYSISPDQERFVRAEPVFYLRQAGGKLPLTYPADLYRPNYLGPEMFMDEPTCIMIGDKLIHTTLRYFSDAAALIEMRTRTAYLGEGNSAFALARGLRKQGANLGDMTLMQWDHPTWETLHETTFYQMKGGGSGLVHEGRYQLADFDRQVARFTNQKRPHTAEEMLQYYYAFLRGGTRPFGKFWGTAIYGQCDTNLAPAAVTRAYDMGARYVWFWTSDHDHHLPWREQLALARTLKDHAQAHPRPSIYDPPPRLDTAIAIPNGYFLSLDDLWWVRVMDKDGKNEAAQKYRRLMQRALAEVHKCMDKKETFDITVDDGRPIKGYRKVVRISDGE